MEEKVNNKNKSFLISRIADEMWNKGLIDVGDEIMESDAKYHGPHMPNGVGSREDWKRAVGMYLSAFPDSQVRYEELIETGDIVVGRWSAAATNTGPIAGKPPTGKPISISGITIYKFSGDKVSEAWEQLDMLGMWTQLGIIKLPGSH
jgi:predicted ester cyclase